MPIIIFIHPGGRHEAVQANDGDSAMLAALFHSVDGIEGECGGCAACGTCHVYVEGSWANRLPEIQDNEEKLLDGVAAERLPNSRLACQIRMTEELDGLVLRVPERQA